MNSGVGLCAGLHSDRAHPLSESRTKVQNRCGPCDYMASYSCYTYGGRRPCLLNIRLRLPGTLRSAFTSEVGISESNAAQLFIVSLTTPPVLMRPPAADFGPRGTCKRNVSTFSDQTSANCDGGRGLRFNEGRRSKKCFENFCRIFMCLRTRSDGKFKSSKFS